MSLQPADEVLVGNCLFHVGFTPVEEGASVAPAPPVTLALQGEDATEKMTEEEAAHLADLTPPAPHDIAHAGSWAGGAAPEPLPLVETGPDSILGEFYEDEEEVEVPDEFADVPLVEEEDEAVPFDEEQTLPGTPAPVVAQTRLKKTPSICTKMIMRTTLQLMKPDPMKPGIPSPRLMRTRLIWTVRKSHFSTSS